MNEDVTEIPLHGLTIYDFPDINIAPTKKEDTNLKLSISRDGVTQPVIVWEKDGKKQVIDGKYRCRAALECGLEKIPANVRHFESEAEAKLTAIEANLCRLHLNKAQRIRLANMHVSLTAVGQGNRSDLKGGKKSNVVAEAAKIAGISPALCSNYRAVIKAGDKGVIDKMHSGEIPISTAYHMIKKPKLPKKDSGVHDQGQKFHDTATNNADSKADEASAGEDNAGGAFPISDKRGNRGGDEGGSSEKELIRRLHDTVRSMQRELDDAFAASKIISELLVKNPFLSGICDKKRINKIKQTFEAFSRFYTEHFTNL